MKNRIRNWTARLFVSKVIFILLAAVACAGTVYFTIQEAPFTLVEGDARGNRTVTDTSNTALAVRVIDDPDSVTKYGDDDANFQGRYDYFSAADDDTAVPNRFKVLRSEKFTEITASDLTFPLAPFPGSYMDLRSPVIGGPRFYLYWYDKNGRYLAAGPDHDAVWSNQVQSRGGTLFWSSTSYLLHFKRNDQPNEYGDNLCVEYKPEGAQLNPCRLDYPPMMWDVVPLYAFEEARTNRTALFLLRSLYKKNKCLQYHSLQHWVYPNYDCDASVNSNQRFHLNLLKVPEETSGIQHFYSPTFFWDTSNQATPWTTSLACKVQVAKYAKQIGDATGTDADAIRCGGTIKPPTDSHIELKRSADGRPNKTYKDKMGRTYEENQSLSPLLPGQSRVYVFGVGQGNFVMFDGYGWSHPVIVDAGSLESSEECNPDGTRRLAIDRYVNRVDAVQIARYLMRPQGVNSPIRRPLVFLSHGDADHTNLVSAPEQQRDLSIFSGSGIFPQAIYLGGTYLDYPQNVRNWIDDVLRNGGPDTQVVDQISINPNDPHHSFARSLTVPGALSDAMSTSPDPQPSSSASNETESRKRKCAAPDGAPRAKKYKTQNSEPAQSRIPLNVSIDLIPSTGQFHGPRINILASNYAATSRNGRSLVVQFTDGDYSVITSGDADAIAESTAIATATRLGTLNYRHQGIWIGSHHGAETAGSNSRQLADAIQPSIVIFSAGNAGEHHGHPRSSVIDNLIGYVMPLMPHISASFTPQPVTWPSGASGWTYERPDPKKKKLTKEEKEQLVGWEFDMMEEAIFNTRDSGSLVFTLTAGGAWHQPNNALVATRNRNSQTYIQYYFPGNFDRSDIDRFIVQITGHNLFEVSDAVLADFNEYARRPEPVDQVHPLIITDAAAASMPVTRPTPMVFPLDGANDVLYTAAFVIWLRSVFVNQVFNSPWGKSP